MDFNATPGIRMKTLVVSFAGGPGATKTSHVHYVCAELKRMGVDVEMVPEFAKDKVWQKDIVALSCQPYITSVQYFNTFRLLGSVEVVVTDSPIFLGIAYQGEGCGEAWEQSVIDQYNTMDNLCFFLHRNEKIAYKQQGRRQSKAEARDKDQVILDIMKKHGLKCHCISVSNSSDGKLSSREECMQIILDRIYNRRDASK